MSYIPVLSNAKLQYKKVTLSSAQILALNGTPVTIIPASGPGRTILLQQVMVFYAYLTAPYVAAGAFQLVQGANILANLASVLTLGGSQIQQWGAILPVISPTNAAIQATVTVANPTGGSGTMDIYVWYYVVSL